jgi:hypothetical protein
MSCQPQAKNGIIEIPNCDDPVFRAWCYACGVSPGGSYRSYDARIAALGRMMGQFDQSYDPEADPDDDYLTPRGF